MTMFLLGMLAMWVIIAIVTCVWETISDTWCDAYAIFVQFPLIPFILLIQLVINIFKKKNKIKSGGINSPFKKDYKKGD